MKTADSQASSLRLLLDAAGRRGGTGALVTKLRRDCRAGATRIAIRL